VKAEFALALLVFVFLLGFVIGDIGGRGYERNRRRRSRVVYRREDVS